MSFDTAIRLTEILLGIAFVQQSIEHLVSFSYERRLFLMKLLLSLLLIIGFQSVWVSLSLLMLTLVILQRFNGPYNGGADRMSILILSCLFLTHSAPTLRWQEIAFGYLSIQLILSYFMSGWVKIVNPDWRTGQALADVFKFSAYPVSEGLRRWADSPRLLYSMSWGVMLFEIFFPIAILTSTSLILALVLSASFHLANAFLFGLNRFFWIWIAAYPSLIWFQQRIFA